MKRWLTFILLLFTVSALAHAPAPSVSGLDLSGGFGGAGGIGGLLARTDAEGSTFYHHDGAGNVTGLMDAQGNMAARYLYGPFGKVLGQWGPMAEANRYQFSSKETEALSGLSYYGFRFYDPGLQRWLNPDPLGERFDGNLYRFNYQNPLSYVDPDGLAPQMVGFNYDLNTGGVSPQYVDQRFGQGYGMGLHGPLRSGAPGMMAGSIVPGVGEAMDLWVLGDPDAKWWEKSLAGASLGANALTGGLLPNIGGLLKAGKTMCKKTEKELWRPYIRKSTREAVEKVAPRAADGRPLDPNTLKPIEGKPDLGHKPGNEFWREKAKAEAEGLNQTQFNDRMNDPSKYQLEDPSANRSHRYELP